MRLASPIGIVSPVRTPAGKLGGNLAPWEPAELLAHVLGHVASSTRAEVDEVICGSVRNGIGNVARRAALQAGLGIGTPALTVDRQCSSSLDALLLAAAKINAGMAHRVLVGGIESASRAPWLFEKAARPYASAEPQPYRVHLSPEAIGDPSMGETAELLADELGITRLEMDAFAYESHMRASRAAEEQAFQSELVPLPPRGRQRDPIRSDETIRADTSLDALARLPPAFRNDGRVTAGNSSPVTDGASGCYAASLETLQKDGIAPDALLTGASIVALHPSRMGMGPALAIPRLLDACGLKPDDVDLFEINEAFAAQILAVNRELAIPADKLNVHGGAIALGHALGATGLRLVATLVHALKGRGARRGVASLCVGGGQGVAALFEVPQ